MGRYVQGNLVVSFFWVARKSFLAGLTAVVMMFSHKGLAVLRVSQ